MRLDFAFLALELFCNIYPVDCQLSPSIPEWRLPTAWSYFTRSLTLIFQLITKLQYIARHVFFIQCLYRFLN